MITGHTVDYPDIGLTLALRSIEDKKYPEDTFWIAFITDIGALDENDYNSYLGIEFDAVNEDHAKKIAENWFESFFDFNPDVIKHIKKDN